MILPYSNFTSYDGLNIRYGYWKTICSETRGTVVLLGGRTEYMEKHLETVGELGLRGYDVYSMDWRGQGLSSRLLKNRHKGYVSDYQEYVNDLHSLMKIIIKGGGKSPFTILSHSMGGHVALRFLHDHGGMIRRAVFVSPMIEIFTSAFTDYYIRALVRFALLTGLKEAYVVGAGNNNETFSGFKDNPLTSDRCRYERRIRDILNNPELALGGVTYGWLGSTLQSIDLIMQKGYVDSVKTSILMVSGSKDSIVSVKAHGQIASALPDCRFFSIKGAKHEILCERDRFRQTFWNEFDKFMIR